MTTMDEHWKERFRAKVVFWTKPAAGDRRRAMAVSNRTGVGQLYAWETGSTALHQLTDRPEGTVHGAISGDGRFIFFLQDDKGNEIGHWARVPFDGGPAQDLTPELPPYASWDITSSRDGSAIGFSAAGADGFTIYVLRPDMTGPERLRVIHRTEHLCRVEALSQHGERLILATSEKTGTPRMALVAFDTQSGERLSELWDGPDASIADVVVSPVDGDARIVASSDASGDRRPLAWDPVSGARDDLPVGDLEGEVVPWDWSSDGKEILLCQFAQAVQRLYTFDVAGGQMHVLDHPTGSYGFWGTEGNWFGPDGEIVAQWMDSTHPRTVIALDRQTGHHVRDLLAPSPVPPSRPWRSISYRSPDGQPIQAWLATPEGNGPWPAVIETHGGPESVTTDDFLPRAQIWLDHGFAYLSVNYRGSTTFGRAFKEAIWGRVGELEVRDVVAGRRYLVEEGIALADLVFLTGWSYGGYITLQAMGVTPGLWAGGMAGVAVADWVSEYEDENEILRAYDRALFGGSPDELPDAYRASSPLTYVKDVDAPVVIIQGRNDTRCPPRQVELYEAAMQAAGKAIEVIWFDVGHSGGGDVEQAISHEAAMLGFALRVVGDRRMSPVAAGTTEA